MKKRLPVICAGIGGAMIGHWAWYLDTTIGCLFFALGIILLVGSWISDARNKKKEKEEKDNPNLKKESDCTKKLTYEVQLIISFFVVILGCILSDIFDFWIYHSIAYVICGLLFIVHPVVPKHLEGIEKAVFWTRIAGVILILIGIFTRVHY